MPLAKKNQKGYFRRTPEVCSYLDEKKKKSPWMTDSDIIQELILTKIYSEKGGKK